METIELSAVAEWLTCRFLDHLQRCSAKQSVKDGMGSTPHSSETSQVIMTKLCTFDHVNTTNTLSMFCWNPPAMVCSTHTWNIHSCDFSSYLPAFFSCAPALTKRKEIISRTMAQKTPFGVRKCPPSKFFFSHLMFGDHFAKNPKFRPVGKSKANKKIRITSKPFKIDKKSQLNMNINYGVALS